MTQGAENPLPASVAAESAILGAILLDNRHHATAAGGLEHVDFVLDSHRRIFAGMTALLNASSAVDLVTLCDWLDCQKLLSQVGGVAYIASLTEGLPRRLAIDDYVRIVKEKSLLRQAMQESHRVTTMASGQAEPATEVLAAAEAGFRRIAGRAAAGGLIAVGDFVRERFPSVDQVFTGHARRDGIPSGFARLDYLTAGFQPRELTILGARPSIGKTAVASNIAVHVASLGKAVAFFSLEMPTRALIDRMCCARGRVDLQAHRHGTLSPLQKEHFLRALADLTAMPLYIDDQAGQTAATMEARAGRLAAQQDLGLVVVDYLGLMAAERRSNENREQVVAAISRAMKGMAKRLGVPVLLLSQLNRELHKRFDKRPILSDLRESGAIEQDADLVLFLHREDYYNREDESLAGKAELIIAKARNGPLGTVPLHFDARICRFTAE